MLFNKSGLTLTIAVLIIFTVTMGFGSTSSYAYAQDDNDVSNPQAEASQSHNNPKSNQDQFQKWALFPIIASSAETGLLLGGMAVRFFKPRSPEIRTNSIDFMAYGSMNQQYSISVTPNLYFKEELYHLKLSMGGFLWPANYYGIGNDTSTDDKEKYKSKTFVTDLLFERKLKGGIFVGGSYLLKYSDFKADEDGVLEGGEVIGSKDGILSGPGIAVTLDTRDNENDARSGSFLTFKSNWFRPAFGSDYSFEKYEIFLRRFIQLTDTTGLALGGKVNLARGNIPFTELNSPDGVTLLRGIENGRYRDRDMAGLQTEYRFPIVGRWGGVVFAETAQVAHELDELTMDGWKYSVGTGIRYALNPDERFNFRMDISFVDGGLGLALNFREAF
jgi:hypothetical protein